MKKNKMMRTASGLLVAVLLTTCIISGTFAKYVTEGSASDTARVAKWGVGFTASTELFAKSYKDVAVTDATMTVKSSDENKVVAPGTTGTGLGIKTTGTPEVSYNVTLKLDSTTAKTVYLKKDANADKTALNPAYEPVKFSVYNGTTKLKENLTLSDLKTLFDGSKVVYSYDVYTGKYKLGTDLVASDDGSSTAPDIKVTWAWAFDGASGANDAKDTLLGNLAVGAVDGYTVDTDYNLDVKLDWIIKATQID